jgi:hypothetical protein
MPEKFGLGNKANSPDLVFALLHQVLPEQTDVKLVKELKETLVSIKKRQVVIAHAKKYHLKRGVVFLAVTLDENSDIRVVAKGIDSLSAQVLRHAVKFEIGKKNAVLFSIPLDRTLAPSKAIRETSGRNTKRHLRLSANRNGDLFSDNLRFETAAYFAEHLSAVPAWVDGSNRLINEFKKS